MIRPFRVANRLLKIELQLKAYQKLHQDELAELWKALDDCKRSIAEFSDDPALDGPPTEKEDE